MTDEERLKQKVLRHRAGMFSDMVLIAELRAEIAEYREALKHYGKENDLPVPIAYRNAPEEMIKNWEGQLAREVLAKYPEPEGKS